MSSFAWAEMVCPFDREPMDRNRRPDGPGLWGCLQCGFELPDLPCGADPWEVVDPGIVACCRHWGHSGSHETLEGVVWERGPDWWRFDLRRANPEDHFLPWELREATGERVWVDGVPVHGPSAGQEGRSVWMEQRGQVLRGLHMLEAVGELHMLKGEVYVPEVGRFGVSVG